MRDERSVDEGPGVRGRGSAEVEVRPARDGELSTVMNVLDGALLDLDAEEVADRLGSDAVLVAVEAGRVLGTCVVAPADGTRSGSAEFQGAEARDARTDVDAHLAAVAVRPGRRGQGVGSALVAAAADRWGALSAAFDDRLRPFYEPLGFEVVAVTGDRCLGVRPADA